MAEPKLLYRYFDPAAYRACDGDYNPDLHIYAVARETPCGYWLTLIGTQGVPWNSHWQQDIKAEINGGIHWSWLWRKKGGKWAYEDRDKALAHYIKRKTYHVEILEKKLKTIKSAIGIAYSMTSGIPGPVQPLLVEARTNSIMRRITNE